jgi:hypothetical protein
MVLNGIDERGEVTFMAETYVLLVVWEEDERREQLGWLSWITERNGPVKSGPS